jgi:arylformamidase
MLMPRNTEHAAGVQGSGPCPSTGIGNDRASPRAQIDKEYDNSAAFPDVPEWRVAWRRRSEAVPVFAPAKLDLAYGAAPLEKLDLFPLSDPDAPTAAFIHGGFWSRNSKETFRFTVSGIHAAGFHAVFVGHTLAPNASMDQIVDQARSATRWVFSNLRDFGLAVRPLTVLGWSSGAHLAAMVMGDDHVLAGMGISGIYDLDPMRRGSINDVLKLDEGAVQRNSPLLRLPARSGPFTVAYGQRELPAFRSQSERFYAALTRAALPGDILALPGHHHHSVLDELYNSEGKLTQSLASLAAAVA